MAWLYLTRDLCTARCCGEGRRIDPRQAGRQRRRMAPGRVHHRESNTDLISPSCLTRGQTVQNRGGAVIKARKMSSAVSAAKAITDHVRTWWLGTAEV